MYDLRKITYNCLEWNPLFVFLEFLLGDDLLVAPILNEGAVARDIYLPKGKWQDELQPGIVHNGNCWLRNYTVQLDELAYFTRIS
jgi:alpha-glucosidase (family GH31 glycosyl hydrolase)